MVATGAETATTKDKEEKEECSTPEYQKLNKGDTAGVKYALDELLVEVVTGEKQGGYPRISPQATFASPFRSSCASWRPSRTSFRGTSREGGRRSGTSSSRPRLAWRRRGRSPRPPL